MRLDRLLVNGPFADRVLEVGVDRDVRGRENASDRAPVWITLS
jgi:exodeoxyribonuclease-3